jgi:hypothetical protein
VHNEALDFFTGSKVIAVTAAGELFYSNARPYLALRIGKLAVTPAAVTLNVFRGIHFKVQEFLPAIDDFLPYNGVVRARAAVVAVVTAVSNHFFWRHFHSLKGEILCFFHPHPHPHPALSHRGRRIVI